MFLVVRLKRFLEELFQCSVDVVRLHKHINPYLLKEIEHDGIYVIKQSEYDIRNEGHSCIDRTLLVIYHTYLSNTLPAILRPKNLSLLVHIRHHETNALQNMFDCDIRYDRPLLIFKAKKEENTLFHPNFRISPPRKQANDQHNRAVYYIR